MSPVSRMLECKIGGVERDPAGLRIREPAAVLPVAHDRTAAAGELHPELMPPTGEWLELDERHLAGSADHPRPCDGLLSGVLLWPPAAAALRVAAAALPAARRRG